MGRPSAPLLDTEKITTAALALVGDAGGFTIPLLAKKLGVSPSSLYNHVSGREEIVELLRERAMSEVALPAHGLGWRETVAEISRAYRDSYARYPRLIPLLTEHAVNSAHAFGMYNALADTLSAADFGPAEVLNIITVLDSFVLGSALDLAAPDAPWRPSVEVGDALRAALDTAASKTSRSDEAFEYGLRALLAGFDPESSTSLDG